MKPKALARMALPLLAATLLLAACGHDDTTGGSGTPSTQTGAAPSTPAKTLSIGFSQVGAESGWRTANTKSIQDEAAKRGIDLHFSDAQQKQENQIKAIRSFIAQHVDVIAFSPVVETGWDQVLKEAKDAGIPVIITDRTVSAPADLYTCFIGEDFIKEGHEAGDWLKKKMNGNAGIAEITGTVGSSPANDRAKGFRDAIADAPGMKIIMSETGDFTRAKGKEVMEAFLKRPDAKQITALFAHNDDMALGAIQAIKEAGLKPAKDIIIVSIDGVHDAFQAMVDGDLNCSVECNPLLGPTLFDTAAAIVAGKTVPKTIYNPEGLYDETTAKEAIASRKY
jgi:ABC-type sugar transport system substrate-binding protein